jgi:hypothetical protein
MKHIVCNGLTAGLILAAASTSYAQAAAEPKGVFVNVNGGAQTQQRSIGTALEFPIYDQTGTVEATQNVGKGGIFDLSAGYRVWSDLSLGIGFTTYSKTGVIVGRASIPHPLFLDRHASSDLDGSSKRTERSVYIVAVWAFPINRFIKMPMLDKVDVALSAGPSFITVEQDVLVGVSVPQGSQQATADIQRRKDSTVGLILGADVNYMVMRTAGVGVGVGGFIRYQGAGGVDLAPAEKQSTGGFQAGGGLRLRF